MRARQPALAPAEEALAAAVASALGAGLETIYYSTILLYYFTLCFPTILLLYYHIYILLYCYTLYYATDLLLTTLLRTANTAVASALGEHE